MEVDSSATVEDNDNDKSKSNDNDMSKSKSTSDEIVSSVEDKDNDNDMSKSKSEASNDNVTYDKVNTESNNNKKYTRAERQKHAFKVQRDKLKESKARIKELEDKLAKYDGLDKDKPAAIDNIHDKMIKAFNI